jgi:hypothetical protein
MLGDMNGSIKAGTLQMDINVATRNYEVQQDVRYYYEVLL